MKTLLKQENCFIRQNVEDWKDAIHVACKPLVEQNYCTEEYVQAVFDSTEQYGPYYVLCENLALIHASNKAGVNETQMAITVLKEPVKFKPDESSKFDQVGVVNGLAYTEYGGDTLQIEVTMYKGEGRLVLTGKLGDVMKESVQIAVSLTKMLYSKYADKFDENDLHIHVPEGAVPKDGPSAGITMATAIFSAITKIPVKCKVAMTGEITLRGRVLPIGGLKEKMLAAKMAGIETVLVPFENERDVDEISKEIKAGLEICYMHTMDEVLEKALVSMPMQVRKAVSISPLPMYRSFLLVSAQLARLVSTRHMIPLAVRDLCCSR